MSKHSETESKKAYEQIEKLRLEALAKIDEAKKLADKHGLCFTFDVAYGMGGEYAGKGTEKEEYDYVAKKHKSKTRKEGEWIPSSHTC